MKSPLVLALIAVAGFSYASFDLTLLPGADGRIHRYDPENRLQLGSFNSGSGVEDIELVPGTGQAAVLRSSDTALYNVWTGQRIAQSAVSTGIADLQWNPTLSRFDAYWLDSGAYVDTVAYPSLIYGFQGAFTFQFTQQMVRLASGRYLGVFSGSSTLTIHSSPTATGAITTTYSWGSAPLISNLIQETDNSALFASSNSGIIGMHRINTSGVNDVELQSLPAFSISGMDLSQPFHLNRHHSGFYVWGRDAASGNWRFADVGPTQNAFLVYGTGVTNVGYTTGRPTTFLAPEPGTLIALGAGAAALLRRKKRKAA